MSKSKKIAGIIIGAVITAGTAIIATVTGTVPEWVTTIATAGKALLNAIGIPIGP
jgi:hypothetical protein